MPGVDITNKGSFLYDKKHAQDEKLCRAQALYEVRPHESLRYKPNILGTSGGHMFPDYRMGYREPLSCSEGK